MILSLHIQRNTPQRDTKICAIIFSNSKKVFINLNSDKTSYYLTLVI